MSLSVYQVALRQGGQTLYDNALHCARQARERDDVYASATAALLYERLHGLADAAQLLGFEDDADFLMDLVAALQDEQASVVGEIEQEWRV